MNVEVLVQGGAVGIAIAALGVIAYLVRVFSNHLEHVARSMENIAGVQGRTSGYLDRMAYVLDHILRKLDGK